MVSYTIYIYIYMIHVIHYAHGGPGTYWGEHILEMHYISYIINSILCIGCFIFLGNMLARDSILCAINLQDMLSYIVHV
jgi:methyl coenzyme M reductase beta subunit